MGDNLHRALERLLAARSKIVRVSAGWQSGGLDTSPLVEPLTELQEAVYLLESLASPETDAAQLAGFGRELRQHYDAVRAAGAGLESEGDPARRLRWLDLIERAADHCIATVARMECVLPDE